MCNLQVPADPEVVNESSGSLPVRPIICKNQAICPGERYMRIFRVLLTLLAAIPSATTAQPAQMKIGVISSLTGPQAAWGSDTRDILLFLNSRYGRDRIQFVIEDDRCDSKDGAAIARKLADVDGIKYVIGPLCSGASLAAAPILDQAGIVTISTLPGSPAFSRAGDYIFRTRPSDVGAAKLLADYISRHHRSVGIIAEQTDYALGMKEQFRSFTNSSDMKIFEEDYLSGTTDFRPAFLRLRQKGVESFLMIPQSENPASLIAKQRRELKIDAPLYGSLVPGSSTFRNLAGDAAEGLIFAVIPSPEDGGPESRKLFEEYVAAYGPIRSVEYVFECTYDAYMAMNQALFSGQNPKDYLYRTTFRGLTGDFSFDANGDIRGLSFMLKQYRNQKAVPVEEVQKTSQP